MAWANAFVAKDTLDAMQNESRRPHEAVAKGRYRQQPLDGRAYAGRQ